MTPNARAQIQGSGARDLRYAEKVLASPEPAKAQEIIAKAYTYEIGDGVTKDFDKAAAWGKAHHRPIFLGEFGAYEAGEMESRARWTAAIVHEARARDFSTAYWEFGSGFGAYDRQKKEWHKPLLEALMAK